jgi:colanic acid biosynthesis glycosyl transferase WcaI
MACWLRQRGHDVRVVTAFPYYPQWRLSASDRRCGWRCDQIGTIVTYRCPIYVPRNPRALHRMLHLLSYAISMAPVLVWQAVTWKPEIIIAVQPTVFAAPATLLAARLSGAVSWSHIQDYEVEAAFGAGVVRGEGLRRFALALERWAIRGFDYASTISPTMAARLRDKGFPADRIRLLPNWVDTGDIKRIEGPNAFRTQLGLDADDVIALYAGNLGRSQGLETLIDAARVLQGQKVHLVIAGDGAVKAEIMAMSHALERVYFLPLQPAQRLNELLNLADIHVLPRQRGVVDCNMPSKLLNMLASGRPIVAAADEGSDVAEVVGLCGVVVAPEDGAAMAEAVALLARNPARRAALGAAGRAQAIARWGRDAILSQFEQCFETVRSAVPSG